jgi:hypothetical protein
MNVMKGYSFDQLKECNPTKDIKGFFSVKIQLSNTPHLRVYKPHFLQEFTLQD